MRNVLWPIVLASVFCACSADVGTGAECPTADEFGSGSTDTATSTSRETGDLSVSATGFGFTGFAQAHGPEALVTIPWEGQQLNRIYGLPAGEYRVLFVEHNWDPDADWWEFCDEQLVAVPAGGHVLVHANPLANWWYRDENRCGAPYGQ